MSSQTRANRLRRKRDYVMLPLKTKGKIMSEEINTEFGAKVAFQEDYDVCDYATLEAGEELRVANYCHKRYIELYHPQLAELVRVRYEDIDKLLMNVDEKVYNDRLAELEAVIRDYYVAKGYNLDGTWGFQVIISTKWEEKYLAVYFFEGTDAITNVPFSIKKKTTKEMFDRAFEFFTCKGE